MAAPRRTSGWAVTVIDGFRYRDKLRQQIVDRHARLQRLRDRDR